jgi:cytochrome P450
VIDELARCPDPAAAHAELRARGAHQVEDGRWVVASDDDVTAVLRSPAAAIGFAADPARPVTARQARMARFSDGPAHAVRRAAVERLLAGVDPAELRRSAAAATAARLAGRDEVEVMATIARGVPVVVLAAALGATDPAAAGAATAELAAALAPPLDRPAPATAEAAVTTLARLLGDPAEEALTAAVSLLFQAFDATAGLIGNAAARLGRPGAAGGADALVADTLRADCPVQLTTRVAADPVELRDRTVPAGLRIVVVLAAAGSGLGFGAGPHACPGRRHALALATGALDALIAAGARPGPGPVAREPRLNLRIPDRLPLRLPTRRPGVRGRPAPCSPGRTPP